VGEGGISGAGVAPTPSPTKKSTLYYTFVKHYRYISNNRTKVFPLGHLSHDNISDVGAYSRNINNAQIRVIFVAPKTEKSQLRLGSPLPDPT
jgi:hypothetical protein